MKVDPERLPSYRTLLTHFRLRAGLSTEEAAWRAGAAHALIRNCELGYRKPSIWLLPRLARVYDLTPTEAAVLYAATRRQRSPVAALLLALGFLLTDPRLPRDLGKRVFDHLEALRAELEAVVLADQSGKEPPWDEWFENHIGRPPSLRTDPQAPPETG